MSAESPAPGADLSRLSPAQVIVLRGIASGKKPSAIVDDLPPDLRVSEHGVRWHRDQIYRKLGIHSIAEATRIACASGLI